MAEQEALLSFAAESHKGPFTRAKVHGFSLLVTGVFYWLPAAIAYVTTRVKSAPKKAVFGIAVLLAVFVPMKRWDAFARSQFWDEVLKYFRVRIVGREPPRPYPGRSVMYGVAPHGIVPFSVGLMQYGELGKFFASPRIATATIVKFIPVFSHMLYLGGAVEATKSEISKVLRANGVAAITPGGIGEMFLGWPQPGCQPDEEYALLHDRKGFVRLALENGTTLVPIFCFGASSIFSRVVLPAALETASRYLRASIMLFFGKGYLPIPYEAPLTYALGEHIVLEATPNPSAEEVDWVHNCFKRALTATFEQHKHSAGWGNKTLMVR